MRLHASSISSEKKIKLFFTITLLPREKVSSKKAMTKTLRVVFTCKWTTEYDDIHVLVDERTIITHVAEAVAIVLDLPLKDGLEFTTRDDAFVFQFTGHPQVAWVGGQGWGGGPTPRMFVPFDSYRRENFKIAHLDQISCCLDGAAVSGFESIVALETYDRSTGLGSGLQENVSMTLYPGISIDQILMDAQQLGGPYVGRERMLVNDRLVHESVYSSKRCSDVAKSEISILVKPPADPTNPHGLVF